MHPVEAPYMEPYGEFAALSAAAFPEDIREALAGYGLGRDEVLIDALPHAGYDIDDYRVTSTRATGLIGEGDAVDLGDRRFTVMHLPGHSPGSVGLWEEKTQTLFSGDAIYDGPLLDELPGSDIAAYVKTIRRLRDMAPRAVHGGHDPSFDGARLVELCDDYLARRSA